MNHLHYDCPTAVLKCPSQLLQYEPCFLVSKVVKETHAHTLVEYALLESDAPTIHHNESSSKLPPCKPNIILLQINSCITPYCK